LPKRLSVPRGTAATLLLPKNASFASCLSLKSKPSAKNSFKWNARRILLLSFPQFTR
jgi:hypothetical protein